MSFRSCKKFILVVIAMRSMMFTNGRGHGSAYFHVRCAGNVSPSFPAPCLAELQRIDERETRIQYFHAFANGN